MLSNEDSKFVRVSAGVQNFEKVIQVTILVSDDEEDVQVTDDQLVDIRWAVTNALDAIKLANVPSDDLGLVKKHLEDTGIRDEIDEIAYDANNASASS